MFSFQRNDDKQFAWKNVYVALKPNSIHFYKDKKTAYEVSGPIWPISTIGPPISTVGLPISTIGLPLSTIGLPLSTIGLPISTPVWYFGLNFYNRNYKARIFF